MSFFAFVLQGAGVSVPGLGFWVWGGFEFVILGLG